MAGPSETRPILSPESDGQRGGEVQYVMVLRITNEQRFETTLVDKKSHEAVQQSRKLEPTATSCLGWPSAHRE